MTQKTVHLVIAGPSASRHKRPYSTFFLNDGAKFYESTHESKRTAYAAAKRKDREWIWTNNDKVLVTDLTGQ